MLVASYDVETGRSKVFKRNIPASKWYFEVHLTAKMAATGEIIRDTAKIRVKEICPLTHAEAQCVEQVNAMLKDDSGNDLELCADYGVKGSYRVYKL